MKTIVWYDRSIRLWVAQNVDFKGDQVGNVGYGPSKKLALSDLQY